MAITIREQLDGASNSADITLSLGAGTAIGDLLVAFSADDFYTAAEITTPLTSQPVTWTLHHTVDGGSNDNHCKVWTGAVTVAGAQNVVFSNATHLDHERFGAVFVLSTSGVSFDTVASTETDATSVSHVAPL